METLLRVTLRLMSGSLIFISTLSWPADLTIPKTFVPSTPATAADVNQNFSATATAVNSKQDRVTGTCAAAGQAIKSVAPDGTVTCETGLDSRVAAMEAALRYMPVGPQTNVVQFQVAAGGWTICHTEPYDGTAALATVLAACNKANLMLACLPTGSNTYTLLAQAPRADVTFVTPIDATTVHVANGTGWYFNTNQSWGFAKAGDAVSKNSCDTGVATDAEQRLCWHTSGGSIQSGHRCGTTEFINNATYQRVVLHRD